jgi:predicted dinucleotide-binding enzyme
VVGETLAGGFMKHGHEVMRASREPAKLADWKAKAGAKAQTGTFAEAAKWGEIIVLAVKGEAAATVLEMAGPENTAGKTVIDTTNPLTGAPVNGVLSFFTKQNDSLMEELQRKNPKAHLVKCFSSVGAGRMVNPDFGGTKPTMFICGNDKGAKDEVKKILDVFGWEVADMGVVEAARAIEPLCILWCIPGFLENSWMHAFKVLK